jgi:hypothetical protein
MSSDKVLYVNPETKDVIATGNVGIGVTNPTSKLHVNGSIRTSGGLAPSAFWTTTATSADSKILFYDNGGDNWCGFGADTSGNWWLRTGLTTTNLMIVKSNGNVGIGTTNPQAKLHVNGTFYAPGCVVQTVSEIFYTSTQTSSQTFSESVLKLNITPKYASSKIVVIVQYQYQMNSSGASGGHTQIRRDGVIDSASALSSTFHYDVNGTNIYGSSIATATYVALNTSQTLMAVWTKCFPSSTFLVGTTDNGGKSMMIIREIAQ